MKYDETFTFDNGYIVRVWSDEHTKSSFRYKTGIRLEPIIVGFGELYTFSGIGAVLKEVKSRPLHHDLVLNRIAALSYDSDEVYGSDNRDIWCEFRLEDDGENLYLKGEPRAVLNVLEKCSSLRKQEDKEEYGYQD